MSRAGLLGYVRPLDSSASTALLAKRSRELRGHTLLPISAHSLLSLASVSISITGAPSAQLSPMAVQGGPDARLVPEDALRVHEVMG